MALNEQKLNQLLERALVDAGATCMAPLVVLGDELGLYKTLAAHGAMTSEELAAKAHIAERYAREWLRAQAAGGYINYEPETGRYSLTEEQAFMLADENSPAYMPPAFQSAVEAMKTLPRLRDAFQTGEGIGWHEHSPDFFCAVERFFRPSYLAHLASEWIPALRGVEEKLRQGATVADIGCGHGASTILMAQAYPKSTFFGFDFHEQSIETARQRAKEAGVSDRVSFETKAATRSNGAVYDLVTMFDCLHDMGDPVGAARHVKEILREDGTWMIVEPKAGDRVEDNLNPVGRIYYSISTMVCTPCSLDQDVGAALGAQAGEARLREVAENGGFAEFRRAAETPFNMVFEAR